jgi:transcriptional regulator GlxA family with amidase domain
MIRFLLFIFVVALWSCETKDKDHQMASSQIVPVMPTQQLNAAFLVVDGVYNSELVAPMDVLHHTVFHHDKGIKVFTIAEDHDTITTFEGLRLLPDYAFSTDSLPTIDILIVPSAKHSMDSDLENKALIDFVRKAGKSSSYVMSLCDGAFVLASAGLLDTFECTTFPGDVERFRKAFPQLTVHENVSFVFDGKVITSAGGAKSYDPALFLVELLYGKKAADGIALGLVIDWELSNVKHITGRH